MQSSVGVVGPKVTLTEIDPVSRVEVVREAGPQMFPPPPKLRAGSSMFDLSCIDGDDRQQQSSPKSVKLSGPKKSPSLLSRFRMGDKDKAKSFWDLSPTKSPKSEPLADNASASGINQLSPESAMGSLSSTTSANSLVTASASTTKKLKWYKKIVLPKSQERKKNSNAAAGDMTPTSTRSFSEELYLGPPVEDSPLEDGLKKKKKKKLLAW